MYFYLVSFPLLGAGLKYIDDAFDEKIYNKKIALVLAPIIGTLWAYTMLLDPFAATILLAVIIGVFLRGKIDNIAHCTGLIIILGIIILAGIDLLYLPLIFIAIAAFIDEVGSDIIDYNLDEIDWNNFWHKVAVYFFDQRWMTKLAILYVVLLGIFPLYFFLAMLLFDGAYLTIRLYSRSQQRIKNAVSA
jgi:hypothetical protein